MEVIFTFKKNQTIDSTKRKTFIFIGFMWMPSVKKWLPLDLEMGEPLSSLNNFQQLNCTVTVKGGFTKQLLLNQKIKMKINRTISLLLRFFLYANGQNNYIHWIFSLKTNNVRCAVREETLLEFYLLILCKYISCPPENVSPLFGSIKKKNRDFSNKLYPSIKQGAFCKCRRNIQSLDDSLRAFPDHEIIPLGI